MAMAPPREPNRYSVPCRLCTACDAAPAAGRLPVPPRQRAGSCRGPSQAAVRKNLSSAPHKLAECPETRNFGKVVRSTRQVFEPDRPWTPLGKIARVARQGFAHPPRHSLDSRAFPNKLVIDSFKKGAPWDGQRDQHATPRLLSASGRSTYSRKRATPPRPCATSPMERG